MMSSQLIAHTSGSHPITIGFLGPLGTYSHEAAAAYFKGVSVRYKEVKTIAGVFDSVASGQLDFGIVPQENTIFGGVIETYDALRQAGDTRVVGETTLRIDHCLLAKSGVKLEDIRCVLSHEQALGQCRAFIDANLPLASTEKTTSTASAARELLHRPPNCASISSRVCATLFDGLEVLANAIQKDQDNFTRFYVLTRSSNVENLSNAASSSRRRALLRFANSEPQATSSTLLGPSDPESFQITITRLLRRLDPSLDVLRIDRRPSPDHRPFRDVYFVELQSQVQKESLVNWEKRLLEYRDAMQRSGESVDLIGIW